MEEAGRKIHHPLIVTLDMDEAHQAMFNALREAHFPAHSNYLDAHITLFHHLPSSVPDVPEALRTMAARPPFPIAVTGIKSIGNGVIFTLESAELSDIHHQLQHLFMPWLKRQDQQPLRPHITVQNKVTAFKASRLLDELIASFAPFDLMATGFRTWHYLGGPWRPADHIPFQIATF